MEQQGKSTEEVAAMKDKDKATYARVAALGGECAPLSNARPFQP
jgi:hypothetical protein